MPITLYGWRALVVVVVFVVVHVYVRRESNMMFVVSAGSVAIIDTVRVALNKQRHYRCV